MNEKPHAFKRIDPECGDLDYIKGEGGGKTEFYNRLRFFRRLQDFWQAVAIYV